MILRDPYDELPIGTDICEYAGHDWIEAGGGLLICGWCDAEQWDDDE